MFKFTLSTLLFLLLVNTADANQCPSVLKFMKRKLNSQETVNLCQQYQGKTLLIVNTASYCGFTPQFKGLEQLYAQYKDQDFYVLGFPSFDFNQEDSNEHKTAQVCQLTYGVTFPMFEPTSVKGEDAEPLFKMLAKQTGQFPKWNFNKYLVDKQGNVVRHYGSSTKPADQTLIADIENVLAL